MVNKIEITIEIIIHATEDSSKVLLPLEEMFNLEEKEFTIHETKGYFDNPITILNRKLKKQSAQKLLKKLVGLLSKEQLDNLIESIEERTIDSRFHMRLGKQELIKGNLVIKEKDTIKIKIHTPVYNKKDTIKTFTGILQTIN